MNILMRTMVCTVMALFFASVSALPVKAARTVNTTSWVSSDGRYAAAFPGSPQEMDVQNQLAGGKGYIYQKKTSEGGVQFAVAIVTLESLHERIRSDDKRDILEQSVQVQARTLGSSEKDLEIEWGTFPGAGPQCFYAFSYMLDGHKLNSLGYSIMDNNRQINVWITFTEGIDYTKDKDVEIFFASFTKIIKKEEYVDAINYVRDTTTVLPVKKSACPDDLRKSMSKTAKENGHLLVDLSCYHSSSEINSIMKELDARQGTPSDVAKHRQWKDLPGDGMRRMDLVGETGVLWMIWPPKGLFWNGLPQDTQSVLVVQTIR